MDKDILDDCGDFIKANDLLGKKFKKQNEGKNYINFSTNKERQSSEDWFLSFYCLLQPQPNSWLKQLLLTNVTEYDYLELLFDAIPDLNLNELTILKTLLILQLFIKISLSVAHIKVWLYNWNKSYLY